MGDIRLFHVIYGGAHELENNPFPYERGLQDLFEKHLRALTGIDFLDSEYSTGQRHSRRIDTLGIDEGGRPVVIEYKRSRDENVINQGLDYLDWLDDHHSEFSELVQKSWERVAGVDFRTPRLLCIASEFPRQDQVAARDSRRRIELLRYRRYGDTYMALEWVFGGEDVSPRVHSVSRPADRRGVARTTPPAIPRHPDAKEPDYSIYPPWNKTSEETRKLFRELETWVKSLGNVRTDAFKSEMSFKRMDAPGREKVIAYVALLVREVRIRLLIAEKYLGNIPPEDGFSRPYRSDNGYREVLIADREHILKAEPLLRAAHGSLGGSERAETP